MADWCECIVTMRGSDDDLNTCHELLATVTKAQEDHYCTAFHDLTDDPDDPEFGWTETLTDNQSNVIWHGQTKWSPPRKALQSVSRRFPDANFEVTFLVIPYDWEVWKIVDGEIVSVMDGDLLTWGEDTSPIYRWSIGLFNLTRRERDEVVGSLRQHGLVPPYGRCFTERHPFQIEAFLATEFPQIDLAVEFKPWTLREFEHVWRVCQDLVHQDMQEADYPRVPRDLDEQFRLVERAIELTETEIEIAAERACKLLLGLKHPFYRYIAAYRLSRMRSRLSADDISRMLSAMDDADLSVLSAIEQIGAHQLGVPYAPTREELEAVIQQTEDEDRRAELQEAVQSPKWAIA